VGLGGGQGDWDDYEWFPSGGGAQKSARKSAQRRTDRPTQQPTQQTATLEPLPAAMVDWFENHSLWVPGDAPRILLVDLDNLRAGPLRWRARMAVMVALARQADHVALAGQDGAVRRARPHLAEYADTAAAVPAGSDLADVALLALVDELDLPDAQALVVSNDGIFAELAQCGPLVVLSPGRDALSDALEAAAARVVDLAELEHDLLAPAEG
jgi:hypothetical protein